MELWSAENLIIFLLAGFSGFDFLKRGVFRLQTALIKMCREKISSRHITNN